MLTPWVGGKGCFSDKVRGKYRLFAKKVRGNLFFIGENQGNFCQNVRISSVDREGHKRKHGFV